ncbi:hypothetical protein C1866_07735 [Eggerthella lenta]|nr:hypothetical protein C1866_07735 [Eggerthella lenta]
MLAAHRRQDRRHAARPHNLARPHRGPRGGGAVMSAVRARGRRGQATVEFVLILPLLVLMLVAVADYAHVARETANVQAASSEGARYAAANPTLSNDEIAAYVREACDLGAGATVTVTSTEAPSKPVTLKSGDKSVTARYAREKVTVKVVEDVGCIFPLKSLGVKGATDDGWQVHSETSSIRSEIERS